MKLLSWLLKTIIGIVLLAVIVVIVFIILLSGNKNVPLDSYKDVKPTETIITELLDDALDNVQDNYSLNLEFNEDIVNKIIFNIIKSTINTNYDPINGETDEQLYINSSIKIPDNTFLVGGKKLIIKNAFTEIKDDKLSLYINLDLFGFIKSLVYIEMTLKTTETEYYLSLNKIKLGKLSMINKDNRLSLMIFKDLINIDKINSSLSEKNIPFKIDLNNLRISANKSDLKNYIKDLFKNEENEFTNELVNVFTSNDNDFLELNIKNNNLNLNINLEDLKVDGSELIINDSIKQTIDKDVFLKSKTQSIAITSLVKEYKIVFSYEDLNKLIYTQANGYKNMTYDINLSSGKVLTSSVKAILFSYNDNNLRIKMIINLFGLDTIGICDCEIVSSDEQIKLVLKDKITLGNNISISSNILKSLLANTFKDMDLIIYDAKESCFIISRDCLNDSLKSISDTETSKIDSSKIEVIKVEMNNTGLVFYLSLKDKQLQDKIDKVSKSIETVISKDTINTDKLNPKDENEKEAIENINNSLKEISSIINDPKQELTSEKTDKLIESINSLSDENKNELLNQVEESLDAETKKTLEELYNELYK